MPLQRESWPFFKRSRDKNISTAREHHINVVGGSAQDGSDRSRRVFPQYRIPHVAPAGQTPACDHPRLAGLAIGASDTTAAATGTGPNIPGVTLKDSSLPVVRVTDLHHLNFDHGCQRISR